MSDSDYTTLFRSFMRQEGGGMFLSATAVLISVMAGVRVPWIKQLGTRLQAYGYSPTEAMKVAEAFREVGLLNVTVGKDQGRGDEFDCVWGDLL